LAPSWPLGRSACPISGWSSRPSPLRSARSTAAATWSAAARPSQAGLGPSRSPPRSPARQAMRCSGAPGGRGTRTCRRDYLLAIAGEGALPALALRDTTDEGSWEPVGEETLYSFVEDAPGFVLEGGGGCLLALVDSEGMAKAVAQNIGPEKRRRVEEALEADGVREYMGEVRLPV